MKSQFVLIVVFTCINCCWGAQKFSAAGMVLQVDSFHHTIRVSCQPIPGYMGAGRLRASVRDAKELVGLNAGAIAEFTLVVDKKSLYAEGIRIREFEDAGQQASAARRLRIVDDLDTNQRSAPRMLRIGESVPHIVLTDQSRNSIDVGGFAGQVVVMNFMYTRCPLPDYCFRLSNNLGNVQARFKKQMGTKLILLSITFDPIHDGPEVLADYARTWKAEDSWHFLTGPVSTDRRLCDLFGVSAWPEEAGMVHSLHTVVIDREGKLAANVEGNWFTGQQLGDLVQTILEQR